MFIVECVFCLLFGNFWPNKLSSLFLGSPTSASVVHSVGRAKAIVRLMPHRGICEHYLPNASAAAIAQGNRRGTRGSEQQQYPRLADRRLIRLPGLCAVVEPAAQVSLRTALRILGLGRRYIARLDHRRCGLHRDIMETCIRRVCFPHLDSVCTACRLHGGGRLHGQIFECGIHVHANHQ